MPNVQLTDGSTDAVTLSTTDTGIIDADDVFGGDILTALPVDLDGGVTNDVGLQIDGTLALSDGANPLTATIGYRGPDAVSTAISGNDIRVSDAGIVSGAALLLSGQNAEFENEGEIEASASSVVWDADDVLVTVAGDSADFNNGGTIGYVDAEYDTAVLLSGVNLDIENTGSVLGGSNQAVEVSATDSFFANSGTITTNVNAEPDFGFNTGIKVTGNGTEIENTGEINGPIIAIEVFAENTTINNHGILNGRIFVSESYFHNTEVLNTGIIQSGIDDLNSIGVNLRGDNARLINEGQIYSSFIGIESSGSNTFIHNTPDSFIGGIVLIGGDGSDFVNEGQVTSLFSGVTVTADSVLVQNSGSISTRAGILLRGDDNSVYNTGTLSALTFGVTVQGNNSSIINDGTILVDNSFGVPVTVLGDGHYFENNGLISAIQRGEYDFVKFENGDNTFVNTGIIETDVAMGAISSSYDLEEQVIGDNVLTNTGSIDGTVTFDSGDDILTSAAGVITGAVDAGGGDDEISVGFGNNVVTLGDGDDTLVNIGGDDIVTGDSGDDTMLAYNGDNSFDGGADNDFLLGGIDDDTLTGGDGDDVLIGDTFTTYFFGNDRLTGGGGDDKLSGQGGADVFVFDTDAGSDIIANFDMQTFTATGADFQSGFDIIQLTGFGYSDASDAYADVSDVDGTATFQNDTFETTITFFGLTANDLSADDFLI